MSVFDDVSKFIFGGADTSEQDLQRAANLRGQQAITAGTRRARRDVLELFPQADINRNLGFQAALDVLGQTIPGQAEAFRGGNIAAQENLLAGLPQFRSAILGGQFDPSALQATELAFDPSFAQQTLPEFTQPDVKRLGRPPARRRPGKQTDKNQINQLLTQLLGSDAGRMLGGDGDRRPRDTGGGSPGVPGGGGAGGANIGSLLSGLSDFLNTPEGMIASAIIPGGGIAQILNKIFGGGDPEGVGGPLGPGGTGGDGGSGFGRGKDPGGGTPGSPF